MSIRRLLSLVLVAAPFACGLSTPAAQAADPKKPLNVVMIVGDDK